MPAGLAEQVHDPEDRLVGAFVRVGRAVVYVEGVLEASDGGRTVTNDEFHTILLNVVARSEAVLAGEPFVP